MELHILLDLPCFIQRVADDALHKLLEDLFAVVQPDLVAGYTLHLLVQCFFYCSTERSRGQECAFWQCTNPKDMSDTYIME